MTEEMLVGTSACIKIRVRVYGLVHNPNIKRVGGLKIPSSASSLLPSMDLPPCADYLRKRGYSCTFADEQESSYSHQFLMIQPPTMSLGRVRDRIMHQFAKLYPEEGPIVCDRLRDAQDCDLDDDFLLGQVVSMDGILMAVCRNSAAKEKVQIHAPIPRSSSRNLLTPPSHFDDSSSTEASPILSETNSEHSKPSEMKTSKPSSGKRFKDAKDTFSSNLYKTESEIRSNHVESGAIQNSAKAKGFRKKGKKVDDDKTVAKNTCSMEQVIAVHAASGKDSYEALTSAAAATTSSSSRTQETPRDPVLSEHTSEPTFENSPKQLQGSNIEKSSLTPIETKSISESYSVCISASGADSSALGTKLEGWCDGSAETCAHPSHHQSFAMQERGVDEENSVGSVGFRKSLLVNDAAVHMEPLESASPGDSTLASKGSLLTQIQLVVPAGRIPVSNDAVSPAPANPKPILSGIASIIQASCSDSEDSSDDEGPLLIPIIRSESVCSTLSQIAEDQKREAGVAAPIGEPDVLSKPRVSLTELTKELKRVNPVIPQVIKTKALQSMAATRPNHKDRRPPAKFPKHPAAPK